MLPFSPFLSLPKKLHTQAPAAGSPGRSCSNSQALGYHAVGRHGGDRVGMWAQPQLWDGIRFVSTESEREKVSPVGIRAAEGGVRLTCVRG